MQSLACTGPLTPALPVPKGLVAVTEPDRTDSVCPVGHLSRLEACFRVEYTKVVVPVPFQVAVTVPDAPNENPGRVPDPPVTSGWLQPVIVSVPERLPLKTVQNTLTPFGPEPRIVVGEDAGVEDALGPIPPEAVAGWMAL
jgi:hypothetical protein